MKKVLIFIMVMFVAFVAYAQPPNDDRQPNPQRAEKIKALYAAYITQQLNLTVDEAQKFWPVHTQFDEEIRAAHKSNLPEIEKEEAVLKVKKKYTAAFTKIIGAERYNKFLIVDRSFRDKIRNRLNEMKKDKKKPNDNKPRDRQRQDEGL